MSEEIKNTVMYKYSKGQHGRSRGYFICPFCTAKVEYYVWSIHGSGKKCSCGAVCSSFGQVILKIKKKIEELENASN